MNWFSNILPRVNKRAAGKTVPEGVWTKCARCNTAIYSPQFGKRFVGLRELRLSSSHQRRAAAFDHARRRSRPGRDCRPFAPGRFFALRRRTRLCGAAAASRRRRYAARIGACLARCDRGARDCRRLFRFFVYGRLVGLRRRRAFCARSRARGRARNPFRVLFGFGRGAHARRTRRADANGENGFGARGIGRKTAAVHQRFNRSDDGRRGGEFCDAGRCQFDRAARAGRIRRSARDPRNGARATAGGFSAQRVFARKRRGPTRLCRARKCAPSSSRSSICYARARARERAPLFGGRGRRLAGNRRPR